jgi:hypothetical protein
VILHGLKADKKSKDPTGGCFCQAREHKLSPYTPICRSCGLVLCVLNPPQYLCPHCSSSLSPATAPSTSNSSTDDTASLIARIESEISAQLAKEARDRERRIEEAKRMAGDFPSLAPTPSPSGSGTNTPRSGSGRPGSSASQHHQPHKVLSLNSHTKKVTVRSSATPSPVPSKPSSSTDLHGLLMQDANEPLVIRVPPPLSEEAYLAKMEKRVEKGRPWMCLKTGGVVYVREEKPREKEGEGGKRSRRRKGKGKENGEGGGALGDGGLVASGSGV